MADAAASPPKSLTDTFTHAVFNWHTIGMVLMVFGMMTAIPGATLGDFLVQGLGMIKSMFAGLLGAPGIIANMGSNALAGKFAATTTAGMHGMAMGGGMDVAMQATDHAMNGIDAATNMAPFSDPQIIDIKTHGTRFGTDAYSEGFISHSLN